MKVCRSRGIRGLLGVVVLGTLLAYPLFTWLVKPPPRRLADDAEQPVLLTAFSSNHFHEAQGLIRSVHLHLPTLRFIVYDLGLDETELERLAAYCRCEVRKFDFNRYPSHVKTLLLYAFKPIVVREVYDETGFVFWVDASVRFKSSHLTAITKQAILAGHALAEGESVTCFTHPAMFAFFNVTESSLFRRRCEVTANYFVLYSMTLITKFVVNPWTDCALDRRCIAPEGHRTAPCDRSRSPDYCGCHRYDQSALSILVYQMYNDSSLAPPNLWRLFGGQPPSGRSPLSEILDVKRHEKVNYFPE